MQPYLLDGTRVLVATRRFYWPGDVLVVNSPTLGLIVHRLIGCYRKQGQWRWVTQADSACVADAGVGYEAILGKVIGGDCAKAVVTVPLRLRARSVYRFLRLVVSRLLRYRTQAG